MNPYSANNFVTIITAEGKYIPYLKSTLSCVSDEVSSMITQMNELHLNFFENAICAFITWLEKNTIDENPYITHYTKSIEESAKDKADIVKIAHYLKMKEPEMMFDFIYESFCDCKRSDEYDNKGITSNDFSMYGAIKDGWIYDYDFCITMLSDISTIKQFASERLKTPNYGNVFKKVVMDGYYKKRLLLDMMNKKTGISDDSDDDSDDDSGDDVVNLIKKPTDIDVKSVKKPTDTDVKTVKKPVDTDVKTVKKPEYIIVKKNKKQEKKDIFDI